MWIRFLLISIVRWIANMLAVSAVLKFLIPSAWSGYAIDAPIWVVSFLLAFAIAEWAFKKKIPGRNDIALFAVLWFVVGFSLDVLFSFLVLGSASIMVQSSDRAITYIFEFAAILLAAYLTRRRKVKAALGEGMEM